MFQKIGIVTALEQEFVAVESLLENIEEVHVDGKGAGGRYVLGTISAQNGSTHHVVLALVGVGNNSAAGRTSLLIQHFPKIESIIMVGIAGGIPNPSDAETHVRLGDIVVSGQQGVIQYDFVKDTNGEIESRNPPRPPSSFLLEAAKFLNIRYLKGENPWEQSIKLGLEKLKWSRPKPETDILYVGNGKNQRKIEHPSDDSREDGKPRVFLGPIASANKLLKNERRRDKLRKQFGVRAVEMEGSGIADTAWDRAVGYFVIRGVSDYCNVNKSNLWQRYAAVAAAGYLRALLESVPAANSTEPEKKKMT